MSLKLAAFGSDPNAAPPPLLPHHSGLTRMPLSNNDGCCVARSNEFKALGIAMGTPYFQLKNREKSGELVFCSSNYEQFVLWDELLTVR